jgi:ABC-type branched-subunit amino acid transport system ATPase component/ABC-type branched-subunit amino acid transport system permease subunit
VTWIERWRSADRSAPLPKSVRRGHAVFLLLLVICVLIPAMGMSSFNQETIAWIAADAIMLAGFNIIFGVTGQMVFSHSFFFGVGAYMTAILAIHGWPFGLAALVSVGTCVVSSWVFSSGLVNLSGFYLAIASFVLPLVFDDLIQLTGSVSGGADGLGGIPLPFNSFSDFLLMTLVITVCALWVAHNIVTGSIGRTWRTLGINEQVAESVGVNVARQKLWAFLLSSGFAGLAGALFAPIFGFISPDSFDLNAMLSILVGAVVGGALGIPGAVVGALLIVEVPQLLDVFSTNSALIYGVILLVALRLIPKGVVGSVQDLYYRWVTLPRTARAESRQSAEAAEAAPPVSLPQSEAGNQRGPTGPIRVDGVTVRYSGVAAASDVTFDVQPGEFVGLIGPNGAGKSTLFNAISGFVRPSSGQVWLGDQCLTFMKTSDRSGLGIARTFQEKQDFGDLTALESVLIGSYLTFRGRSVFSALALPRYTARERAARQEALQVLRLVGLADAADRRVSDFPYGDQKLLQIARTLVTSPRYLLLDEPTAGLNPAEIHKAAQVLGGLRDMGLGMLLVEHNVPFVTGICSRVIVMDHGSVIAAGTGSEILASPAVQEAYLGRQSAGLNGGARAEAAQAGEPPGQAPAPPEQAPAPKPVPADRGRGPQ